VTPYGMAIAIIRNGQVGRLHGWTPQMIAAARVDIQGRDLMWLRFTDLPAPERSYGRSYGW
jgi:hypothetical protein